jgi:MFS family permease
MLRKISLLAIVATIMAMGVLRFWKLDTIPDGYHVDEVSGAVTMHCFVTQGCDAELRPWPLFGSIEYGQDKPPTYIYPGIVWAKFFGATVPSYRAFGVFGLTIGLIGLFFLSRTVWSLECGLLTLLAASCSPWMWVVGRVLMESYFAPVFTVWGLYFFWRSSRWWDWALAGAMFAFAMYSYPPARMQMPLMMAALGVYEWGRRAYAWRSVLSLAAGFILSLLPLVLQYLHHYELSRRFGEISIFSKDYLHALGKAGSPWDILTIFIHNYLLHLSPGFLFLTGDPSYVHSTRHLGIFSGLDIAALIILVGFLTLAFLRPAWSANSVTKNRRWLLFLAANFFIGIIPSALTNQELPHALRMCGSWLFMMLFTGFMWWTAAGYIRALWPAAALAGILSASTLAYQYFVLYPKESRGMFDYWIKDTAENLKTQEDWQKFMLVLHRRNYHLRYFMVHRLGMTCRQANDIWWAMYHDLDKRGLF